MWIWWWCFSADQSESLRSDCTSSIIIALLKGSFGVHASVCGTRAYSVSDSWDAATWYHVAKAEFMDTSYMNLSPPSMFQWSSKSFSPAFSVVLSATCMRGTVLAPLYLSPSFLVSLSLPLPLPFSPPLRFPPSSPSPPSPLISLSLLFLSLSPAQWPWNTAHRAALLLIAQCCCLNLNVM